MREFRNKINWLQNILSAVSLIGLTLFYLLIKHNNLDERNSIWELLLQVIPDLIAALVAVLVVYFAFVRKGISAQTQLIDEINNSISRKVNSSFFLFSQKESDDRFNLKERLFDTKEVWMICYSCKGVIADLRTEFIEAIRRGLNLRVLVIAPDSKAMELLESNSSFRDAKANCFDFIRRAKSIRDEVKRSTRKRKGNIEIRSISWIPSCSIIFCIPKHMNAGIVQVKIYPPSGETPSAKVETHMVIKEIENKSLYEYFFSEYNEMWHDATVVDLDLLHGTSALSED